MTRSGCLVLLGLVAASWLAVIVLLAVSYRIVVLFLTLMGWLA